MHESVPFSDASNSLAGARHMRDTGKAMTQKHKILLAIADCTDGATFWQLERMTGLGMRQVTARVRSLVLDGVLRDSGRSVKGPSGVLNTVWELGRGPEADGGSQTHGRIAAAVGRTKREVVGALEAHVKACATSRSNCDFWPIHAVRLLAAVESIVARYKAETEEA